MEPIRINNADIRGTTVIEAYRNLVAGGKVTFDKAQEEVAETLTGFAAEISRPRRFFSPRRSGKNGYYIFGEVGRGKSMLMDLFFTIVPLKSKRRVHFHEFMQNVHERLRQFRETGKGDPLPKIASDIFKENRLLCFDEFQVGDIADAMIMSRLFAEFFKLGMNIVATSNTAPDDLYKNGLQRASFLPFIGILKANVETLNLNAKEDYRLRKLKAVQDLYFTPLGAEAEEFLNKIFADLTNNAIPEPAVLHIHGRELILPETAGDVAKIAFEHICGEALGAADYLEISCRFGTVLLSGIPKLSQENRNEARRFVYLIDALYEHKVKLICTAAAAPNQLYTEGDGAAEFKRTVSRLIEMQSENYIATQHFV